MKLFTGYPLKLNLSQIKNIGKWSVTSVLVIPVFISFVKNELVIM